MRRTKSGTYAKMPLNYEELRVFIDTIVNPEYRLMVAIMTIALLRSGEVIKVRKEDLRGDTILVRKTKVRKDKSGIAKNPYRELPIPEWVQEIISEVLPLLKRQKGDLLFQRQRGGGQLTVNGINDRLDRIFSKVDTNGQKVTGHTIRKTAAIQVDESCGHDLSITQLALGHQSISTTGIYVMKSRGLFQQKMRQAFA